MFNAQLFDADGIFIATVDAWWQEAGVAAEIDSRAYHLAAEDQDRTTGRHDGLTAHGILPLHFPPKRIKTDAPGIIRPLQSAIEQGTRPAAPADHGGPAGRLARPGSARATGDRPPLWVRHKARARAGKCRDKSRFRRRTRRH